MLWQTPCRPQGLKPLSRWTFSAWLEPCPDKIVVVALFFNPNSNSRIARALSFMPVCDSAPATYQYVPSSGRRKQWQLPSAKERRDQLGAGSAETPGRYSRHTERQAETRLAETRTRCASKKAG